MKGTSIKPIDPDLENGNTAPDEVATNQEAAVLPWLAGEQKVAVRWISPVYNQFTKEAPAERPGKK